MEGILGMEKGKLGRGGRANFGMVKAGIVLGCGRVGIVPPEGRVGIGSVEGFGKVVGVGRLVGLGNEGMVGTGRMGTVAGVVVPACKSRRDARLGRTLENSRTTKMDAMKPLE